MYRIKTYATLADVEFYRRAVRGICEFKQRWSKDKKQMYEQSFTSISDLDFRRFKVVTLDNELANDLEDLGVKHYVNYTAPSRVQIVQSKPSMAMGKKFHFTAGGLNALLQAFDVLHKDHTAEVIFANDGNLSILDRSGLQAHEHPTQYDEYSFAELFKSMSYNFLDTRNPESSNYASFAIPLRPNVATLRALPHYTRFFLEFARQKMNAGMDVTARSKNTVEQQKRSLDNFSFIDNLTRKTLGKPIMERHGRYYFCFDNDYAKLKKGLDVWQKLGIESHLVSEQFLREKSLFNLRDTKIHAYFMPNDGFYYPNAIEVIIEYLLLTYPERFTYYGDTNLSSILINSNDDEAFAVRVKTRGSNASTTIPVNSVYCSLGHDQVFKDSGKRMYKEILATSSTGDWVQHISSEELNSIKPKGVDIEEFLDNPTYILPFADKYNLHVTKIGWRKSKQLKDIYNIFYRITAGAIVEYQANDAPLHNLGVSGHSFADKRNVINQLYKMNVTQLGIFRPITVGSCSRKIDLLNTRSNIEDAKNVVFSKNASGTGVVDAAKYIL